MSLARRPEGFSDAQIEAGIVATLPVLRLRHAGGGAQCLPASWPFKRNDKLLMRYRGIPPEFEKVAGETFLFGTAACSSPATLHPDQVSLAVSQTPDNMIKKTS